MLSLKVTINALCLYEGKIPEFSPGLWHGITWETAQKGDLQFYQTTESLIF